MIDQKIENCGDLAGSLLERYVRDEELMDELHDGTVLRQYAAQVVHRLPRGPVELLSTSRQGAGLAAACAALRTEPTRWRELDLLLRASWQSCGQVVLVEMINPGAAWQNAVFRRFPDAQLIFATEARGVALAA